MVSHLMKVFFYNKHETDYFLSCSLEVGPGQGEPRKIKPTFQPPVTTPRPPSEVRSSPGSPPSSATEPQTPRGGKPQKDNQI